MKITYIKLENVAGLMVGSGRKCLEIDFDKSMNKIVSIQGRNGIGKTVLLSSLTPFASVTSLDERSTLPYIIPGRNGYKEIHYLKDGDKYCIRHHYTARKDGHNVKSYISLNGTELNDNGNVKSFLSLVEDHLGLTPDIMRLIRIGSNVASFISLGPAQRKDYIGNLIDEIDVYLKVHKKVSEDLRVLRVLISTNKQNLYNCHISDPVVSKDELKQINKRLKGLERDHVSLIEQLAKVNALIGANDINELRREKQQAEIEMDEFNASHDTMKRMGLIGATIDQLMKRRNDLANSKVEVQSRIRSYMMSADNALRSIERLEVSIRKITANNDIQSLTRALDDTASYITAVPDTIRNFVPCGITSTDAKSMINILASYNQTSKMLYTLSNRSAEIYLKLVKGHKSIDKYLKEQSKRSASRLNESSMRLLLDQIFSEDIVISPACDSEYEQCPYYRLASVIDGVRTQLDEAVLDPETLREIEVISNNMDMIHNQLDVMAKQALPDSIREIISYDSVLKRFSERISFFEISPLYEYANLVSEHELYVQSCTRLKEYQRQLAMYKQSGVESHQHEIEELNKQVEFYNNNIATLERELTSINSKIATVDGHISTVSRYTELQAKQKVNQDTIDRVSKLLSPLENSESERIRLEVQIKSVADDIKQERERLKSLELSIAEYDRLVKEGKELNDKFNDLSLILTSVSTTKGIPVIYMQQYLNQIQRMANQLLSNIYDDGLRLASFNVTQTSFEVPYVKSGTIVPDVKYASQSEISLITMALSFALSHRVSGSYNILLLDEIDAGLDDKNRSAFLKMLDAQMATLNAEQVFMISHNISQMINVPMDCIKLDDSTQTSKLQNVIYQ